jgi:hypothetical protein
VTSALASDDLPAPDRSRLVELLADDMKARWRGRSVEGVEPDVKAIAADVANMPDVVVAESIKRLMAARYLY